VKLSSEPSLDENALPSQSPARGEDLFSVDGETFQRCHSERSEESPQLLFHGTAEILRRPDRIGTPQDDKPKGFSLSPFSPGLPTPRSKPRSTNQSGTSRLLVAVSDARASVRFAQTDLFLLLWRSNLCKYALKTRIICSIQKSDVLCFQVLLSFVSTIYVFLRNSFFPHSPGPFRSLERRGSPGARLRQTVRNTTTVIGYQKAGGLSSEKFERPHGAFSNPQPAHAPVLSRKSVKDVFVSRVFRSPVRGGVG